jgi:ABC-type multidrug transport system fused ATPase/permease subunit
MDQRAGDAAPPGNVVRRLYTEYAEGSRRFAALGAVATLVGRALGLVPAFVIGLAVDAIFLAERPFALPFVPAAWVPTTATGQLYFAIAVLLVATAGGAVASWVEDWGWSVTGAGASSPSGPSARSGSTPTTASSTRSSPTSPAGGRAT